ncbi:MAG: flagellar hook capping FlgD N-terminal domain-containing protein [Phycisphaerales bacterium]
MPVLDELGAAPGAARAPSDAFSDLRSEDFVKIMFTELSNQDPLKPNDSSALLEQMSSLRSIQSDIDLGQKLETLVSQNQMASASNLLGRLVSGVSETNERVIGVVATVSRTPDGPVLTLDDGTRVPFSQVDELADPDALPGAGGGN